MLDNSFSSRNHCYSSIYFFTTVLAFIVIVFGAYTRLTDAGLGCPDWPACYGHWIISKSLATTHQTLNATKAWTEMIHRYLAGTLGLMIFYLTSSALYEQIHIWKKPRFLRTTLPKQPFLLLLTLSLLVVFQALLGMWTVTLKLYPPVVMAHLLGGMITLSLLWYAYLKSKFITRVSLRPTRLHSFRVLAGISLVILIIQLFLGGLTSANYAALVCLDFPFCNKGAPLNLHVNFLKMIETILAGLQTPIGQPLSETALIDIQMLHRIGALVTSFVLGGLIISAFMTISDYFLRLLSLIILFLLAAQIFLGITNVLALLPLSIAVMHNAIAALLLLAVITFNYYFYRQPKSTFYGD